MGLADRDYYRSDRGRGGRWTGGGGGSGVARLSGFSVNTWIIVVNVAVHLVGTMMQHYAYPVTDTRFVAFNRLEIYGHFSTAYGFFGLEVWRLLTFQFLHGGFMHLFFNMFGLFIFGSIVEQFLGRRRYLAFYLICGIFGGLAYLLLNLIGFWLFEAYQVTFPGALVDDPRTPLIGASAGVFGVIMACAYIAPNAIVQLLLPPIPLRMKWFAYGYVAIAFFSLLAGASNAGGDAAHLGGAIAGFIFIRNAHLLTDFFDIFKDSRKPARDGRRPRHPRGGRASRAPRHGPDEAEIDRILAKVSTQGVHSLTEAEKRTLAARTDAERRRRA